MILKKDKNILKNIACMCKKNNNYNDDIINYSYNNYLNLNKDILKKGNLKLDKNIARFSLPEVVTCSCNCHGCYAKKRLFDNVKKSRLSNLFLIEHALNNNIFKEVLKSKIKIELLLHDYACKLSNKKSLMRWHDSGDIYNLNHFYLLIDIAWENPYINFFTYTKNYIVWLEYLKLENENKLPKNFNIVSSFIYNHVNYFDFMHDFKNEFKALKNIVKKARKDNIKIFFCNYNFKKLPIGYQLKLYNYIKKNNDVIKIYKNYMPCGKCYKCSLYKYVIFIKH